MKRTLILSLILIHSLSNGMASQDSRLCRIRCCISNKVGAVATQCALWGWFLGFPLLSFYGFENYTEQNETTQKLIMYGQIIGWSCQPGLCAVAAAHLKQQISVRWANRNSHEVRNLTYLDDNSD